MTGKQKCEILKDIRRKIAEENGIDLPMDECNFEGECLGFCEKCDAEARLLDELLKKRAASGEEICVVGVSQPTVSEAIEKIKKSEESLRGLSISGLGLSKKAMKILCRAGIQTVGDLLSYTSQELDRIKGVDKIRAEIASRLAALGLSLRAETAEPKRFAYDDVMGYIVPPEESPSSSENWWNANDY